MQCSPCGRFIAVAYQEKSQATPWFCLDASYRQPRGALQTTLCRAYPGVCPSWRSPQKASKPILSKLHANP